jgi:hypothetical protein
MSSGDVTWRMTCWVASEGRFAQSCAIGYLALFFIGYVIVLGLRTHSSLQAGACPGEQQPGRGKTNSE